MNEFLTLSIINYGFDSCVGGLGRERHWLGALFWNCHFTRCYLWRQWRRSHFCLFQWQRRWFIFLFAFETLYLNELLNNFWSFFLESDKDTYYSMLSSLDSSSDTASDWSPHPGNSRPLFGISLKKKPPSCSVPPSNENISLSQSNIFINLFVVSQLTRRPCVHLQSPTLLLVHLVFPDSCLSIHLINHRSKT